jgi:succinate dehydrogenase / fumarate reductase membrane anchor subunit
MSYYTPKRRALGLGTAHGGTHHWWLQRVTSVALLPLTVLFVIPFAQALGDGHEAVVALYSGPFHALVAILFIGVTFHHLAQGLQVVIEDYVHHKGWRAGLLLGNTLLCGALGIAGVFAVLKIALAG